MKPVRTLAALLLMAAAPAAAQPPIPTPASAPEEPDALPLYPADGRARNRDEDWQRFGAAYAVRNVTRPTITPFLPAPGKATGAAVVVVPGGAFMALALQHEGWNVARWLADHGIAAFVLKYRLNKTPHDLAAAIVFIDERMRALLKEPGIPPALSEPRATDDALAALKMVHARAGEWGVEPHRVGMIGFSAGAMTTMNAALEGRGEDRPAFIGYIYGPMQARAVPADAPPMFAAIAVDDSLFGNQPWAIVDCWRSAKRPVEFHAYERGDHGFGMGWAGTTTQGLLPQFQAWMAMHGWTK